MFYFQNAVLNENKGFTIYLQCLCLLGFKIHTDFFHCSDHCHRQDCPLVQFLNVSKVKLKERAPKAHSCTFGHIPTLTLSSGTSQTHGEPLKEFSSQTLNTKGVFFFPLLAQQFPVLVQLLVLVKRRGLKNSAGLEECRMRVFSSNGLIFQIWCKNNHHQPRKKTQGVVTGVTVKTKSVQVKEEIHVEPQKMLGTTHVLLVKTTTPLTYMELFLVLLLSSLIVKL